MKKIELTGKDGLGKVALVDDDDYDLVKGYSWYVSSRGYAKTNIRKIDEKWTKISMHRLILGLTDPKKQSDHKYLNKLDNRRCNLRICNNSKNQMNKLKQKQYADKLCSSIYKGVYWNKDRQKWRSRIQINGKKKHLGYFTDEVEAAQAYDSAAIEIYGEYKLLNFGMGEHE